MIDVWAKPDGSALADLESAARGPRYLVPKVKIEAFWLFPGYFDGMNWFRRGKKLLGVAEGLPGNVWGDPVSLFSTAGVCKQQVSMRDHRGRREVARRGGSLLGG